MLNRRTFLKASLYLSAYNLLNACRSADRSPPTERDEAVLVVGAGIAGLAAAQNLISQGFQVTILEGRDRIGGRIWTDRSLGVPVDLGASWIHGVRGNPISNMAAEFEIETKPTSFDDLYISFPDGQPIDGLDGVTLFLDFEDFVAEVGDLADGLDEDISAMEGVRRTLAQADEPLSDLEQATLNWLLVSRFELDWAADLEAASLLNQGSTDSFPGGDHLFPGGYDQVVDKLAQDVDIRLEQSVRRITYGDEGVQIETGTETFEADLAVITLPLGVLKAGSVTFSPPLPSAKQTAIGRLGMGVLDKIALRFPEPFWVSNAQFFGYISEVRGEYPVFLNAGRYLDTPLLMGFMAGSVAQSVETRSDADIVAGAMTVLRTLFGPDAPDPTDALITRWAADPFSLGAYSFIPVGASVDDYQALASPVGERLFFAGEATHPRYPATVHGAFLSGIRAAEEIADL